MHRDSLSTLNPDLIINREAAIDRITTIAAAAAEQGKPNFVKQIQLVRREARILCPAYRNCKEHNWCMSCSSGLNKSSLFRGETCLGCKLLTTDALQEHKSRLVQIQLLCATL